MAGCFRLPAKTLRGWRNMWNHGRKVRRHIDFIGQRVCRRGPCSQWVFLPVFVLGSGWLCQPARAQSPSSVNPAKNIIRGMVVNSTTHEPVGHALVYSEDDRFATMTDDYGRFEFEIPTNSRSYAKQGH